MKCSDYNFTKQYIRYEIGPFSEKYSEVEKDRDKFKKWFKDVKPMLEMLNVVDYWKEDNQDDYNAFLDDFKYKYNILADINALAKITD